MNIQTSVSALDSHSYHLSQAMILKFNYKMCESHLLQKFKKATSVRGLLCCLIVPMTDVNPVMSSFVKCGDVITWESQPVVFIKL